MLVSIADRLRVHLRFGKAIERRPISARCHASYFAPGSVFCRIWWEGNEYGTIAWQLSILQAEVPRKCVQRVVRGDAGRCGLLHVQGNRNVQRALEVIRAIEAQQVDLTRRCAELLAGDAEPPRRARRVGPLCADRHAAALLRRSIE